VLGIDRPVGRAFRCILPGQAERYPSASIYRPSGLDLFLYRDWHICSGIPWLPLSWVRAANGYGRVKRLARPESARWYLRLFHEAGVLRPLPVELPRLPSAARDSTRKVASGFALLLGLRWLTEGPGEPAPFARSFAAVWCGIGERAAGEAIRELLALDVIRQQEKHRAGAKAMRLFLPGSGTPKKVAEGEPR